MMLYCYCALWDTKDNPLNYTYFKIEAAKEPQHDTTGNRGTRNKHGED